MKLLIKPNDNTILHNLYMNHSTFHDGDSGIDLFIPNEIIIDGNSTIFINLQIKCEAFENDKNISYYLYPRSSLSKTPLRLSNSVGIIDAGYRGNIIAAVDNIKDEPYKINAGERLFQICSPTLSEIQLQIVNNLSITSRGEGGFGSTS